MKSERGRFKIVKEMFYGVWKFTIMKKKFIGWSYVRCDNVGDIDLNCSSSDKIKRYDTEEEAESAVRNLMYDNEIS